MDSNESSRFHVRLLDVCDVAVVDPRRTSVMETTACRIFQRGTHYGQFVHSLIMYHTALIAANPTNTTDA